MEDFMKINQITDRELRSKVLNIYLVSKGLRDLFYDDNAAANTSYDNNILKMFTSEYNVKHIVDEYGRSLYVKNVQILNKNKNIAELLNYFCANHENFGSSDIDRYGVDVIERNTNTIIYSEMCDKQQVSLYDLESHYDDLISTWNESLPEFDFTYDIVTVYSYATLLNDDVNYDFFHKNLDEYLNMIENTWFIDSKAYHFIEVLNKHDFNLYFSTFIEFIRTIMTLDNKMQEYVDELSIKEPNIINGSNYKNIPYIIELDDILWKFYRLPDIF